MDFRPHNRRALDLVQPVVDQVTPQSLGLPTPCPPWTVEQLLKHMVSQHLRWESAARGRDADADCPLDQADLGSDPAQAFRASAAAATEAFAAGADDQPFVLPELGRTVPLGAAISFHFLDFMLHGWDVAVSIGVPFAPDDDLTELALRAAQVIPDAARQPGAAFAPVLDVGQTAAPYDQLLGVTGRDPAWKPPGAVL